MAFINSRITNIFQLKISLVKSNSEIWRCLQVPSNFTFYQLHRAIRDSMGWEGNVYSFEFKMKGKSVLIGVSDGSSASTTIDATRLRICSDLGFSGAGDKASYVYDFGNFWEHEILLEAILPLQPTVRIYPVCINGAGMLPANDTQKRSRKRRNSNPEVFNCHDVVFEDFVSL